MADKLPQISIVPCNANHFLVLYFNIFPEKQLFQSFSRFLYYEHDHQKLLTV